MSKNNEIDPVIDEVLSAANAHLAAIHTGDWDSLADHLADDLTYTHMNSHVENKSENIAGLQRAPRVYESSDVRVRALGESAAILTGINTVTIPVAAGEPRVIVGRILQVWRKTSGNWQLAAHQTTGIPTT
jgi:ketosteroid isomerase-like protein